MPEGFQSINNANSYQIDGNNINLSFVRKGSISSVYNSEYRRGSAVIPVSADEVLVFRCTSAHCALVFRNATSARINTELASGGSIIEYWVFGKSGFTASGFGLQVFAPGSGSLSSRIVYDSNFAPFSVAGAVVGGNVAGASLTLPAGRSYGVVAQQVYTVFNRAKYDLDYGVVNLLMDAARVSGNVAYVQRKQVLAYDGQLWALEGTWSNNVTSVHLVIDVTGL